MLAGRIVPDLGAFGFTGTLLERRVRFVLSVLVEGLIEPPFVDVLVFGLGVMMLGPIPSVDGMGGSTLCTGWSVPPGGVATSPLTDPGIFAMRSDSRVKSSTLVIDLRGFVIIVLLGKAVGAPRWLIRAMSGR